MVKEDCCVKNVLKGLLDHCRTKIPEKIWKPKSKDMVIRGKGYIQKYSQPQSIVVETCIMQEYNTTKRQGHFEVKRYAELIGNYENIRIKSLIVNK